MEEAQFSKKKKKRKKKESRVKKRQLGSWYDDDVAFT